MNYVFQINCRPNPLPAWLVIVFILLLMPLETRAQAPTGLTTTQDRQLRIISYGGDLQALLGNLSETFDETIGFEVSSRERASFVKVELENPKLVDILNVIVLNKPIYLWRKSSSAIQVYPADGSNPFLDTPVTSFHVKNVSPDVALTELLNLSEVRAATRNMDLHVIPSRSRANTPQVVSLDLDGIDLRTALSRIANDCGSKFWTFQTSGQRNNNISITIN